MRFTQVLLIPIGAAFLTAQTPSKAIIVNLKTAHWTHEKGSPPETEGVVIRSDAATGATDLLARYPAGHVIKPHFHDSNEHIFVAEGQLTLTEDTGKMIIDVGGFAFLPAHEVQRIACTSSTRCSFYLSWDGNPKSHPAP